MGKAGKYDFAAGAPRKGGVSLSWRPRDGKSGWLATAGYTLDNWHDQERDLRQQLLRLDAFLVEESQYGRMVEIRADLIGPNGRRLAVRSFWMTETYRGQTKFVTMYPDKERSP